MRLRFSLRLAFVVLTLSAIALYWWIARPTIVANRFVAAVQKRDYEAARSLLVDKNISVFEFGPKPFASLDMAYAEVFPRDWSDLFHCRRRLIFRLGYQTNVDGRHVESTSDAEGVANISGVQLEVTSSEQVTQLDVPFKIPDGGLLP
jgi:hypothetical protein